MSGNPIRVDDALLRGWPLPAPQADGDKESRGRVLVIAGSRELCGAALLAATAALRAGAGKLVIATPRSAAPVIAATIPEARVIALPENASGGPLLEGLQLLAPLARETAAVLAGPGMCDGEATAAFVNGLLPLFADATIVLDALALDGVLVAAPFARTVLLTPHAGEFAHITGMAKEDVERQPVEAAMRQASKWNAVVALKGASTCIAPPAGRPWMHEASIPGLGTSGSGDVLAGIAAGLAARGASCEQAGVWAVALHARAGARLAQRHGSIGLLARELAGEIPALMDELAPGNEKSPRLATRA